MAVQGKFITFEGGEGSGKTSAIKAILPHLEEMGYKFILTREPGGTPIAEEIRNVILSMKSEGMDGSVKFIYKTNGIKKAGEE